MEVKLKARKYALKYKVNQYYNRNKNFFLLITTN